MFTKGNRITQETALRLQQLRKQAGLSTREMAARMGMTQGGYSKNERGINFPGLDTLQRLARDFDISMDWLIFNKGPMHYKEKGEREKELEQTVKELTQKIAKLQSQLDEEHNKQEKASQEKANAIETRPEVRELLDHMVQDSVFYH